MTTFGQLPVNFRSISGSDFSILLESLQKQMSKTTLVQSNRTSIDRSTSFFQREFKQQQAAVTTATTRSDRRSSRPERREEDDVKVSGTPRTKPEGAEEKSPLICELTRQPVAPPRRKKPVPGPVFVETFWTRSYTRIKVENMEIKLNNWCKGKRTMLPECPAEMPLLSDDVKIEYRTC